MGEGLNYHFACNGVVVDGTEILAASIAGPETAIKALRASLYATVKPTFDFYLPGQSFPDRSRQYLRLPDGRVKTSKPHKIGYGAAHMVFVSLMPTLIHARTEETLWQHIERATTTPLKREWLSWILPTLKTLKRLREPSYQYGLNMAICSIDDATLDKIVMAAVQSGKVKL